MALSVGDKLGGCYHPPPSPAGVTPYMQIAHNAFRRLSLGNGTDKTDPEAGGFSTVTAGGQRCSCVWEQLSAGRPRNASLEPPVSAQTNQRAAGLTPSNHEGRFRSQVIESHLCHCCSPPKKYPPDACSYGVKWGESPILTLTLDLADRNPA